MRVYRSARIDTARRSAVQMGDALEYRRPLDRLAMFAAIPLYSKTNICSARTDVRYGRTVVIDIFIAAVVFIPDFAFHFRAGLGSIPGHP